SVLRLTEDGDHDPTLDFGFVQPLVSVGDYVWVDTNRDGIQNEDGTGIPGVTLVLTGPDDEPVTDVYGNPVEPTVTDGEGFYTFDGLPALEEGQSYTVTIDQDASAEALKPYIPTIENPDADRSEDSSTWVATSTGLTEDGDRDPTLDFGFVQPMVSVGDFVWVDTNGDGIQDEGEPGIPGVTLVLTGPNGEPVTDVYGNVVEPTVTDREGRYSFDGLPVLAEGESYTVSIDREASAEALAPYAPTIENPDADRAEDSSTWVATSTGLTQDGERDPTLDFGFVLLPDPVEPEPTDPAPGDPEGELPASGADVAGFAAAAAAALILGLAVMMAARRRTSATRS
ncbi:MAG TPA: SdrD B-like domain-containing protein, partial [Actinomycetaceae bacterium]|nr:SdrD B-like domain-containing protein [Actinomycetaceae bacterium]